VVEEDFEPLKVAEEDRRMLQSLQGHFEDAKE
jgi:hypothetical protein